MGVRIRNEKDISGCAISGMMSETGRRFNAEEIMRSIANMRERGNGLGGGFAGYGIYPDHAHHYALHILYETPVAQAETERIIGRRCVLHGEEAIPTRPVETIRNLPLLHRYFVTVQPEEMERHYDLTEDDLVVDIVMEVNRHIRDAFVFSSGKNMGVFKGVGYPEEIGEFFMLDCYEAYLWTAHSRFPTNTTGWWGGAHPFCLLDWSVVHNGEISSYGINRRYLANFGYDCTLRTDTEVITYIIDLLVRKHGLSFEMASLAMAPPFWAEMNSLPEDEREIVRALRITYGGALLNGPFSILLGFSGGMLALNDRIKLRPMVAARKDNMLYVASEESAIRIICPSPDTLWHAEGGKPIIGRLKTEAVK